MRQICMPIPNGVLVCVPNLAHDTLFVICHARSRNFYNIDPTRSY